jgi:multiple sugar transport system ATP-binding protein
MTMADRIVVLNNGVIEQIGTPMEIYSKPASAFVAGFIGSPRMNLIEAHAGKDGKVSLPSGAPLDVSGLTPGKVTLGIRPEALAITASGKVTGQVIVIEHLGGETLTYVDAGKDSVLTLKGGEQAPAQVGERVKVGFDTSKLHIFDATGRAIRSPQ